MRAGDIVFHHPSGEHWIVAYQDGAYMSWCGWPEGEALVSDCEVVTAVTDQEHREWLARIAASRSGKRAGMAAAALAALAEPVP